MPNDKWDQKFIYPTKEGGFTYFQSDDILDDDHFNGEGDVTNSSNGEWTFETDGPTSVQIFRNSDTANSIGGCNMSFTDTVARGYAYKQNDPRDIELTFQIKFQEAGSDNGFAIEGPTGRHSGDGCCQGFAYKLDIQFQENPPKFRFRKEMFHVSNHNDPKTGVWTHPKANFSLMNHDEYVGFKYIHFIKENGVSQGKDSVVLEAWFNPSPDDDGENWILLKRTEDKGGWGDDGDECDGDSDQIGAWSNSNFRLKSNTEGGVFQLRYLSLREIDPTGDFDSAPDNPGTAPPQDQPGTEVTVKSSLTLQRDINIQRFNPCALSGLKSFYNNMSSSDQGDFTISNSSESDRTKAGEICRNSDSVMLGKIIQQLDVKLKRGSVALDATPTVDAHIVDGGGSIRYTSPTHLDPSTLTTSYQTKTFDFGTNTRTFQVGDKVVVEYTSTDATKYVEVAISESEIAESISSQFTYFDNGTEEWVNIGSDDLKATMYED